MSSRRRPRRLLCQILFVPVVEVTRLNLCATIVAANLIYTFRCRHQLLKLNGYDLHSRTFIYLFHCYNLLYFLLVKILFTIHDVETLRGLHDALTIQVVNFIMHYEFRIMH